MKTSRVALSLLLASATAVMAAPSFSLRGIQDMITGQQQVEIQEGLKLANIVPHIGGEGVDKGEPVAEEEPQVEVVDQPKKQNPKGVQPPKVDDEPVAEEVDDTPKPKGPEVPNPTVDGDGGAAPAPAPKENKPAPKAPAAPAGPPANDGGATAVKDLWYEADPDKGQHPENVKGDGKKFTMTVKPNEEAVRVNSKEYFASGKFEVSMKSAAVMPGIVTAVYLASDTKARTGDNDLGKQDEIDFEFKGNEPTQVQTNVFLAGKEDLKLIEVGGDSSEKEHSYGMEWNDKAVMFYIDGKQVRIKELERPLLPMKVHISVWTTTGGWPGLKKWAGDTDWSKRGGDPVAVTVTVLSLPKAKAADPPK